MLPSLLTMKSVSTGAVMDRLGWCAGLTLPVSLTRGKKATWGRLAHDCACTRWKTEAGMCFDTNRVVFDANDYSPQSKKKKKKLVHVSMRFNFRARFYWVWHSAQIDFVTWPVIDLNTLLLSKALLTQSMRSSWYSLNIASISSAMGWNGRPLILFASTIASCMACVAPTPPDGLNCKLRERKEMYTGKVSDIFFSVYGLHPCPLDANLVLPCGMLSERTE